MATDEPLRMYTLKGDQEQSSSFSKADGYRSRSMSVDNNGNKGPAVRTRRPSISRTSGFFLDFYQFTQLHSSGARPRSTAASRLLAARIRKQPLTLREKLFLILEEPTSSFAARCISLVVRVVTLLATAATTLDSIDGLTDQTGHRPWVLIMYVCNSFFLLEAFMRFACYIPFARAFLDPFILLDVLTVVPFVVRLTANGGVFTLDELQWQRVLQGFASIRILKLCRYYEGASLLARAFSLSMEQLLVPLFLLLLTVTCCSTVLYHIEYDDSVSACVDRWVQQGVPRSFLRSYPEGIAWNCDDACASNATSSPAVHFCATCLGYPTGHPECLGSKLEQQFQSIPHAVWFTIVTVTTVGLGDVAPSTWTGQCFTSFVILLGVLFLAMPLSTVGEQFRKVWEERQLYRLQQVTRQLLAENSIDPDDCLKAFRQFDPDGNGLIDANEFTYFIQEVLGLNLSRPEVAQLWRMLDINNTGAINFVEFTSVLYPKSDEAAGNDLAAANSEGVHFAERRCSDSIKMAISQRMMEPGEVPTTQPPPEAAARPSMTNGNGPSRRGSNESHADPKDRTCSFNASASAAAAAAHAALASNEKIRSSLDPQTAADMVVAVATEAATAATRSSKSRRSSKSTSQKPAFLRQMSGMSTRTLNAAASPFGLRRSASANKLNYDLSHLDGFGMKGRSVSRRDSKDKTRTTRTRILSGGVLRHVGPDFDAEEERAMLSSAAGGGTTSFHPPMSQMGALKTEVRTIGDRTEKMQEQLDRLEKLLAEMHGGSAAASPASQSSKKEEVSFWSGVTGSFTRGKNPEEEQDKEAAGAGARPFDA